MKNHLEATCYKRRDAMKELKDKKKRGGKAKANAAQEDTESTQSAEFAGNASTHDFTNPNSPLLSDAGSDWIVDTGATCHMTPHRHWFNQYTPNRTPIRLANNDVIYSVGMGTVRFQPVVNGKKGRLLEFERVLHVPDLRNNLLSVLYLTLSNPTLSLSSLIRSYFDATALSYSLLQSTPTTPRSSMDKLCP